MARTDTTSERVTSSDSRRAHDATSNAQNDRLWDVDDVAAYTGLSVSQIYKMIAPKARANCTVLPLPVICIGGRRRFRKSDIDDWLERLKSTNDGNDPKTKAR